MKILIALAILILPFVSFSQRLHVNVSGGVVNYQGDLQDKPFTFEQSGLSFGAGLKYDLTSHFSLRAGFLYGRISADDKLNKAALQIRNLNFESKITEGSLALEYSLFNLDDRKFSPYVFAGAGIYHFNPYTYDSLGTKVFLEPLSTEGQGLPQYPARQKYALTQFNIPFGMGIRARLTENVVIGYEVGMRKLFTDYLDDVSSTYVDAGNLLAARGSKAVEMAYRGGELKNGDPNYPAEGSIRGGATQKDWYYFQGITLSIGLPTANRNGSRGRGQEIGCPVRVR